MFIHIAIFKWKTSVKESDIETALNEVEALQNKISGIIEISTGKNQSRYGEGYTHVVLVKGDSKKAIEAYRKHPDHQIVASRIEAMEEHGIGVDFETQE
jgi:heme-degrading monooxygenase HmoA